MVNRIGKAKRLSDILPAVINKLIERASQSNYKVVEDSSEWYILRDLDTGELDLSHRQSATYSRVTFQSSPFTITLYWAENGERCHNPTWLKIHREKVYTLL